MGIKRERKLQRRIAELERDLREVVRERDERAGEARSAHSVVEHLLRKDNPEQMIDTLLTGIAPLFLGYKDAAAGQRTRVQELITAMGSQGLDESAGVGEGRWFPDVEFDETMEAESQWPTAGTVSSPTKTQVTTLNGSYKIENGQPVRNDGTPMFQAGATGPRPASANE